MTNQRPVTVATKASAIEPVPSPTSTPQSSTSCQLAVMNTVSPLPAATSSSATGDHPPDAEPVHQRGGERRGQAEQQQVDRDRERDRAARPAELVLQRVISTPGVARKPAAPSSATKATAATSQARWMRRGAAAGGRGGRVTRPA